MSDLQALFDKDPLHLTRADVSQIVDYLRDQRKNFLAQGQQSRKPKATPAEAAVKLADLGL